MTASPEDLWSAVKAGRSAQLDWLPEHTPLETIAATLTALANSHGGTLLLGITGATSSTPPAVPGLRDGDAAIDRVLQALLAIEPPLIIPMPRLITVQGQPVVIVAVPPGMPHVYAYDGRYLVRTGTDNAALKPRDLRRLIFERGELSFETEVARGASLADLDWDKAKSYVNTLGGTGDSSVETVLHRRGCLIEQDGRLRPTHAGMLLFGRQPQQFIRGAEITAVRFAGEVMADKFTREDITGTLPDQLRRAEAFLVDHLRKGVHLGRSMARADTYEYPLEAARELVVNAIAHRDYSIDGDGVRLFIFRDRMEVISPGGLPGPVTITNIKDERFSRNPIIVQVLADMGFIERLGYGVDRVIDLMREQRLREPAFTETAGGFRVVLHNEVTELPVPASASAAPSLYNGHYNGIAINSRQEVALNYLANGSTRITNSDLQALCSDVHPETIRRDLADLVTKNILRKLGQKRGSYYVLLTHEE